MPDVFQTVWFIIRDFSSFLLGFFTALCVTYDNWSLFSVTLKCFSENHSLHQNLS